MFAWCIRKGNKGDCAIYSRVLFDRLINSIILCYYELENSRVLFEYCRLFYHQGRTLTLNPGECKEATFSPRMPRGLSKHLQNACLFRASLNRSNRPFEI